MTFTTALHIVRSVATRVPADAWDNPSCCSAWTARQVAGHASWVLDSVAAAALGVDPPERRPEAEIAGDDPAATVRPAVDDTLAALDHPGTLHKVAATPFGEMPIDSFLGVIWVDPLTHAWDIADATGIDHGIDDATAERAHAALAPISDGIRGEGMFDAALDTPGDSAVERFIAFTGRRSVR